ncbi:MAG: hypothetical protein R3D34_09970 [Nitratireductor sp.]
MKSPVIIVLSPADLPLANRIRAVIGGSVEGQLPRVADADAGFNDVRARVGELFRSRHPVVASWRLALWCDCWQVNSPTAILEPPVLAVASDGSSVVPLLGGHHRSQ